MGCQNQLWYTDSQTLANCVHSYYGCGCVALCDHLRCLWASYALHKYSLADGSNLQLSIAFLQILESLEYIEPPMFLCIFLVFSGEKKPPFFSGQALLSRVCPQANSLSAQYRYLVSPLSSSPIPPFTRSWVEVELDTDSASQCLR